MIAVADIEQRLRDQVDSLVVELLPAARREGPYWKIGNVLGDAGDSLVIHARGVRAGLWTDYAADVRGDMLDLIGAALHLPEKRDAVAWAKRFLHIEDDFSAGRAPRPSPEEQARRAADARDRAAAREAELAAERQGKIRRAQAVFLSPDAVPIAATPAEAYLAGRGLSPGVNGHWPGALRYHPEMWNREAGDKIPAMLAAVYSPDGQHVATHRTFLCRRPGGGGAFPVGKPMRAGSWGKIDSPNAKMVLGALWGGFVPINKGASGKSMRDMPEGEAIYVTEGIEDAVTVRMAMPGARIICAVALGNIGAIILPPRARTLVVVADRDEKEGAVMLLERVIAAQQARGVKVHLVMPPPGIKDMNDWLVASQGAAQSSLSRRQGDAA